MTYDVAVVGAGPAGCSAVHALAGSGLRVAQIERLPEGRYERYHRICGEAVSDRTFERLGWTPGTCVRKVDTIRISFPGGVSIDIPAKGRVLDRPEMLRELREGSGCNQVRGSVLSVGRDGDAHVLRFTDGRELRCRWLIGADGAHSVVRRDVFGTGPTRRLQVYNCIAEGEEDILSFTVGDFTDGFYGWRFPSAPGTVSIGFPRGHTDPREVPGVISWAARDIPFGVLDKVVDGRCLLVGDAACLANPLCFGGIGAGLLSGAEAARAILKGRPARYQRWVSRSPMFSGHFLSAHDTYASWDRDAIADAMEPFRGGYSIPRGALAMIRRPRWAEVYMSTFIAFRLGWRRRKRRQVINPGNFVLRRCQKNHLLQMCYHTKTKFYIL